MADQGLTARTHDCGGSVADDRVRLATWNVDHDRSSRRADLTRSIRQVDADVRVLTETRLDLRPGDDY